MKFRNLFLTLIGWFIALSSTAQLMTQSTKIDASDRKWRDLFGYAVDISGNHAIVGAYDKTTDLLSSPRIGAGVCYFYSKNSSGTWSQSQMVMAFDRSADYEFGFSVAMSDSIAVIGSPQSGVSSGSAYTYRLNPNGSWSGSGRIKASDFQSYDAFGGAVDVEGDWIVVGAASEDHDTSGNNSMSNAGSVYMFQRIAGVWTQTQKIVAFDRKTLDRFGSSVAISGSWLIIGVPFNDKNVAGLGTVNDAGAVYIYQLNSSGQWIFHQKIIASDRTAYDRFGYDVDISGDYLVAGASDEDHNASGGASLTDAGSAYVFKRNTSTNVWSQSQKIVASDRTAYQSFGESICMSGDKILVGAYRDGYSTTGTNYAQYSGKAYYFLKNASGIWNEQNRIVASDRDEGDFFGYGIGMSGNHAIIGAYHDEHDEFGIDSLYRSGSAYIFSSCPNIISGSAEACAGDSVFFKGTYYHSDTIVSDTVYSSSALICDSVSTFQITFNPTYFKNNNYRICAGESIIINGKNIINAGIYKDTLATYKGCDSIIQSVVTVDSVDGGAALISDTLVASQLGGAYQWYHCKGQFTPISGATSRKYHPSQSGFYAVVVIVNGCKDTSNCLAFEKQNPNGLSSVGSLGTSIYPNPNNGKFSISDPNLNLVRISLYTSNGAQILNIKTSGNKEIIISEELPNGLYFLELWTGYKTEIVKLVVFN